MPKVVDHEERRGEILNALWRVVGRDGASAISIRNVAAEVGQPKSTIGNYFPSRLSLLAAAVDQLGDAALKKVAALDLTDGRLETACAAVMAVIPDSSSRRNHTGVWIMLIAERQTDPAVRELLAQLDQRVEKGLTRLLRTLQASGLVHHSRQVHSEAARLHALVDGLSLHTLHDPVGMPPKRLRTLVTSHLAELSSAPVPALGKA